MAKSLSVKVAHQSSADEIKAKMVERIGSFAQDKGVNVSWSGTTLSISGKGLNGSIYVTDSAIEVDIKVGLPASLQYYDIKQKLENELDWIVRDS